MDAQKVFELFGKITAKIEKVLDDEVTVEERVRTLQLVAAECQSRLDEFSKAHPNRFHP